MKNFSTILLTIFFLSACQTDENSLAFVIPDNRAEIAEVSLTTKQKNASFYYLLSADQLIINWGDGSRLSEYMNPPTNPNWIELKPLEHQYATIGDYALNIRMLEPNILNFSNTDSLSAFVDITKLNLTNCSSLKGLFLRKQSLTELDLTSTDELQTLNLENSMISKITIGKPLERLTSLFIDSTQITNFDCLLTPNIQALSIGLVETQQDIQNIDSLYNLEALIVRGNIGQSNLSVIHNDALQLLSATNSNITQVDVSGLSVLSHIDINQCSKLESIILAANDSLQSLSLTNNTALSARALNSIFSALPSKTGNNTILLSGNAGDTTCDRTIATQKGWVFE